IDDMKAMKPLDEAGLTARSLALVKSLEQINTSIAAATEAFNAKSIAIKQIHDVTKERREEGFRLNNQLEILRSDLFAAQVQQKALEDELVRVEENLKRLQRRE